MQTVDVIIFSLSVKWYKLINNKLSKVANNNYDRIRDEFGIVNRVLSNSIFLKSAYNPEFRKAGGYHQPNGDEHYCFAISLDNDVNTNPIKTFKNRINRARNTLIKAVKSYMKNKFFIEYHNPFEDIPEFKLGFSIKYKPDISEIEKPEFISKGEILRVGRTYHDYSFQVDIESDEIEEYNKLAEEFNSSFSTYEHRRIYFYKKDYGICGDIETAIVMSMRIRSICNDNIKKKRLFLEAKANKLIRYFGLEPTKIIGNPGIEIARVNSRNKERRGNVTADKC